jgi:long-chain acyl-CoA synthetase
MKNRTQDTTRTNRDTLSYIIGLTSPQILFKHAEKMGADKIAIREKAYGVWQPYTWKEFLEYTRSVCLGLISLGLMRGENIALITDNRPEWLFCQLGAQAAGAVTVNLFGSEMGTELVYDLNRLDVSYIFVEHWQQAEKILAHRDVLTQVKRVIFIDPANMMIYKDEPWLLSFSQLMVLGKHFDEKKPHFFTDEMWKGKPDDPAMIIMTSGVTGIPKPVIVSHANLMETAGKWLENVHLSSEDDWVSFSPCAGLIEQTWCTGTALACGMTVNFPETSMTVMNDMREIGPSIVIQYPGFWEYLMSLIQIEMEELGPLMRWIYNRSSETGKAVYDLESKGDPVPFLLKALKLLFKRIITIPLMDRLGLLRVRHAYTGGNPISPEVIKFFRLNGFDLKQCYGLAETGGMFQFQEAGDPSIDTVGRPLPGTDITLTEDYELVVSGKFNFSGYYRDTEATSACLRNGLVYTGDSGFLDDQGRLAVTGKKEDIILSPDGHAFSRDFVETRIKESPYIKEAVIWGKDKPYLIAFIGIDFDNAMRWAKKQNISIFDCEELIIHPSVEHLIRDEIHAINSGLPAYMRTRKIILINRLLESKEEFTKSGMARRKLLFEQYRDVLDAMYLEKDSAALTGRVRDDNDDIRTVKAEIRIITVPEGGR